MTQNKTDTIHDFLSFLDRICEKFLHYNAFHRVTWQDAKTNCSHCNASLADFSANGDATCIGNLPRDGIWIGLKKNSTNFTEIRKANMDDLFISRLCESRNFSGHFENVSCTETFLPSICKRGEWEISGPSKTQENPLKATL